MGRSTISLKWKRKQAFLHFLRVLNSSLGFLSRKSRSDASTGESELSNLPHLWLHIIFLSIDRPSYKNIFKESSRLFYFSHNVKHISGIAAQNVLHIPSPKEMRRRLAS